jgi:putative phage-type endonuclease
MPIEVAMSGTPEWLAARPFSIGSSEAAGACGLSSYETPLHIYARKTGELPEIEDTDAMWWGRKIEPLILERWLEKREEKGNACFYQYPCPMYRRDGVPFQTATPDAILTSGEGVEIKSTTWRRASELGAEGTDEAPAEWVLQCQQAMAVCNLDAMYLVVLIDKDRIWEGRVERNEALIERITAAEAELWDRIQRRDPPEPNWQHDATPDLIRTLSKAVNDEVIELPPEVETLWGRQQELAQQIKSLETERELCRSKVAFALGNAGTGVGESLQLVRKEVKETVVPSFTRKSYITIREVKQK